MSETQLRVLVLADARSFHTRRFVHELRRQGCDVLLASFERGGMRHFRLYRRTPVEALHYPLGALQIARLVKRYKPDVVNPHFASGYGYATALSRVRRSVPVVLHLLGSDIYVVPRISRRHRWKTGHALARADFICSDSVHLLETARSIRRFDDRKFRIIPWGLERRFLDLYRRDFRLERPLRIIVPRHHETVYRNPFLLSALAEPIRDGDVEITFPGFGSLSAEFKAEAKELVGDRLRYFDRARDRDRFMRIMTEHQVYLSNAETDSSPATLIESMGLGLIPVAADNLGLYDWLDVSRGFLFPSGDADALRAIVARLLRGDGEIDRMRERNHALVSERGVFEDNIRETIDIMRGLARDRSR